MTLPTGLRLVPTAMTDTIAAALVAEVQAWRWHDVPASLAADLAAAGVRMPTVERVVEFKRMFVRAAYRRRGYARILLTALEVEARAAGAQVVVLETGTQQPEAIALYEAAGYVPITVFGPYADSPLARAYGKVLCRADAAVSHAGHNTVCESLAQKNGANREIRGRRNG